MPRANGLKQFLSPVKGLVTEQSPLSPIEDSTLDEDNMDFSAALTTRFRRKGLNVESGGSFIGTYTGDLASFATNHFLWDAVGGDAEISFHVFQFGRYLLFFEDTPSAVTANKKGFELDLNDLLVSGATDASTTLVDLASGRGYLLVVGSNIEPHYIEYDATGDSISAIPICLFVRDFDGVDDGLAVSERPSTLSDEHNYNLLNQGWYAQKRRLSDNTRVDVLTQFFTDIGDYPSNADVASLGMVDNGSGVLRFDSQTILDYTLGNTHAPRGHFVINPFNIDYVGLEGGTTSPDGVCNLPGATGSPGSGTTTDPDGYEGPLPPGGDNDYVEER